MEANPVPQISQALLPQVGALVEEPTAETRAMGSFRTGYRSLFAQTHLRPWPGIG